MSAITIRLERGKVIAIGLMSGTSHDGVSAAVVELDERKTETPSPPGKQLTNWTGVPGKTGLVAR